ncbi:UPF0280 family protein [Candidatus Bathyarchaeota archaeon]|jgi:ApbE superfamily uncharacterized protein (UPF0280 family)|nr:UPF0280 family protein [Candidatus Bathyarchaeota archaeon]
MKLFKEVFQIEESQCTIITDKSEAIQIAKNSIKHHRCYLKEYIRTHPKFFHSLEPIFVNDEPLVAKLMAEASEKAKVGPMAAVAGVLADLTVKDMTSVGCKVAVVENGGEISAVSNTPIDVAVVAGDDPLSKRFGFRLNYFPIGVATSSGRFSHAFSFGDAEAAVVFCKNAGLADAAATAVCNVVKGKHTKKAIQNGIDIALSINGVEGVIIIFRGLTGTAGKIPKIIKVDPVDV